MKRLLIVFLLIISTLLFLVAGCTHDADKNAVDKGDTAGKVEYKLNFAMAWPPTGATPIIFEFFADEINKRTDGRVKIEIYYGGELVSQAETYDGTAKGIADIGHSRLAYTPGRFPVALGYELPGMSYNNTKVSVSVFNDLYNKFKPEELDDTKVLWFGSTGPGYLYTLEPVENLDDLKDMEIRGDGVVLEALEGLGAIPVSMPIGDVYLALDRGVINGTLDRFGGLVDFGYGEVTDYCTLTRFIYPGATTFTVMNLDTWNSLPPDIQAVIEEVAEETKWLEAEKTWEHENDGLKFMEETGMKLIHLSPEEEEKFLERILPVQDKWVDKINEIGLDGKAMLEEHKLLVKKYNDLYPEQWPDYYYELVKEKN